MKAVLSGKEMKAFDTRSIRGYGIPSLVLMERAALAVAEKAEEILKKEQAETVWSVCGFGNNIFFSPLVAYINGISSSMPSGMLINPSASACGAALCSRGRSAFLLSANSCSSTTTSVV